jgi:hypothetical protein
MPKVIIDMTMSLDGYVAGPDDGLADPLGKHGGMAMFDWFFSGSTVSRSAVQTRARTQSRRSAAHVRRVWRLHLRPTQVRA